MSAVKDELQGLLDRLPEEELCQVRDYVKVLLKEPEELTKEETLETDRGEKEFQRGDWVRWQDIRRGGV